MHKAKHVYSVGKTEFQGWLATMDNQQKRPAILVAHDWSGCNEFAQHKAEQLAELAYVGFAMDLFGDGKVATTNEEKSQLITPLLNDRATLLQRLQAGLAAVKSLSMVDTTRIAAIGFCFGGLSVLDLARSGVEIRGVVSFHGLLGAPQQMPKNVIKAKVLALHGYEDPMVKPDLVNSFAQEMTAAKADWQIHMYGHTMHAFTNPQAHDSSLGLVYKEIAAKRSWIAMKDFLTEIFA